MDKWAHAVKELERERDELIAEVAATRMKVLRRDGQDAEDQQLLDEYGQYVRIVDKRVAIVKVAWEKGANGSTLEAAAGDSLPPPDQAAGGAPITYAAVAALSETFAQADSQDDLKTRICQAQEPCSCIALWMALWIPASAPRS